MCMKNGCVSTTGANRSGFAYEKSSKKRPVFKSPKMRSLQVNSSYSFIEPFKSNVIIVGEVTTTIIDFDNQDLVHLEQISFLLCLFYLLICFGFLL